MQAEDTLYRLSKHYLCTVSDFFDSTFSIAKIANPEEGMSDECPIFLPPSFTCADFDVLLWYQKRYVYLPPSLYRLRIGHGVRYESEPSQENILRAISTSRRWSVRYLYDYAFEKLQQSFHRGDIHAAIVLGVAREYGIPALIRPAVRALADPTISVSSWSTDPTIICHMSIVDVGVIARMKERIFVSRGALCAPPPDVHNQQTCVAVNRAMCSASWRSFWVSDIVPKLLMADGEPVRLSSVKDQVTHAEVPGMMEGCMAQTVAGAIRTPGWRVEWNITDAAVDLLMVEERVMLEAGGVSDDVRMAE